MSLRDIERINKHRNRFLGVERESVLPSWPGGSVLAKPHNDGIAIWIVPSSSDGRYDAGILFDCCALPLRFFTQLHQVSHELAGEMIDCGLHGRIQLSGFTLVSAATHLWCVQRYKI